MQIYNRNKNGAFIFPFWLFCKTDSQKDHAKIPNHWEENCGLALLGSWVIWIKTGNFFGVFVCVQTCEYEIIKLIFCLVIEVSTIAKKCMCSEIKVAACCFACKYIREKLRTIDPSVSTVFSHIIIQRNSIW